MAGFFIHSSGDSMFMPYDLLERVLQFMANDIACLKTFTLVCHSWSFASRAWLFRRLTLNPRRYYSLLALIQGNESCSFLNYCRVLDLHSIDVRAISPSFVPLFTTIKELRIQQASVPSLKDLFQFASSFPQLRSIALNDVSWSRTAPIPLPSLPAVDRLEVYGTMEYGRLFEAIGTFSVFPNLQHLNVGPIPEVYFSVVAHFISRPDVPGKIQSLALSLACEEPQLDPHGSHMPPPLPHGVLHRTTSKNWTSLHERYHQIYGLEPCSIMHPDLRHFRLNGFVDARRPTQSTALIWTPKILAALNMPYVQRIEMSLMLDRAGQLDQYGIHWTFMDFAFSSATHFIALQKVVFIVLGTANPAGVADLICRRMPLSTELGILYVRSGEVGCDRRAHMVW